MFVKKPWVNYFLDIAEAVSTRSPDPSTKVGCVIVSPENRIIATGYNGFPQGIDESQMSLERPLKYYQIIHAEDNAICHATQSLRDATLYVTQAPCDNCLKRIINVGIKKVFFKEASVLERFNPFQMIAVHTLLEGSKLLATNAEGESYASILKKELIKRNIDLNALMES